jgi:outer membrane protein OmpA-like peptidoglycan-associated protein
MTRPCSRTTTARTLVATTIAAVLLVACAGAPVAPDGAQEARARLTQLQADPKLASLAPLAMKQAEAAVITAEMPEKDATLSSHRVYLAEQTVEIARAQAQTRYAENQRTTLSAQRETARLDSRTREVDIANAETATARYEVDAARAATTEAEEQTAELQRQIDAMQAKVTDRGLVLTLGDVLFASGTADLKPGAVGNLNQLITFLGKYPSRTVMIEGHTDSVGSASSNQVLSQHRADSVRSHLVRQGIDATRLTTMGAGESAPVAGNDSDFGRQQNRRVEIIISNPALASR